MEQEIKDSQAIDQLHLTYTALKKEIGKTIIGQDKVVEAVILSLLCKGHSVLIGVPGLAKTLLIQTLSKVLNLEFNRIQFTPDLMPSDITGSEIFDQNRQFNFIKGPIFSNIILADEINRTPPKTQAALLEAMQEKNVTVAGKQYPLPNPFMVLATQNPIEQEGTYPLPAQLDRFLFSIMLDYPSFEEEIQIVKNTTGNTEVEHKALLSAKDILELNTLIRKLPVTDHVYEYTIGLVSKTRPNTPLATEYTNMYLQWGAGPRASQNLILAAKAHAALHGKYSVDKEDVKAVAYWVLSHRIVKNYKAEAEGISEKDIIQQLL
jgi:MoxR-like ATPase